MSVVAFAQMTQDDLRREILYTWETAQETWVIPLNLGPIDISINKIIWFIWIGAAITFLIMFIGSRILKDRPAAYQVIVEEIYGFGRNHLGGQMGEEGRKWFPYTLSLFIFILTLNVIGLLPNSYPVTSNLSFTLVLALCTFFIVQQQGISRNGLGGYVSNWLPGGLPDNVFGKFIIAPFLFLIEALSRLITQPLTLAVRLYANMLAGSLLIYVFLSLILYFGTATALVSIPATVVFAGFKLFVSILQAYIFAILSQVYIEMAMFGEEAH